MKYLYILITFLFICTHCFAQHSDESRNIKQLEMYQDSLAELGHTFVNNENDLERKNANYQFIKTLVNALKVPNSFLFPFDSLKSISILNAPDNRFRILTWHIMNDDGSYRFYGAIQINTGGALRLYPLNDYSPALKTAEDSVVDNRKWYGAQYYKIIRVDADKTYYTLLGWKGYTDKATHKVIEILSFNRDNKPVFGLPVFDLSHNHKRVIFTYTRQSSMLLRYVPEDNLIVFDHLSPPDNKSKNIPESYGPDLTYDGYKLKNGRWVFVENLDMRNVSNEKDDNYVDPKRQAQIDQLNSH
jgi:hypothetical protein